MNFNKIKRLAASKLRDEKGRTKEWLQWYENQQGKAVDEGDEVIGPEKFKEVKLKIVDIWERPWESVAAYKDVPRLASRFHVIGEDGKRLDPNVDDIPSPRLGRKGQTAYQQRKEQMEANGETIPEGFLRSSQPGAGFLIRPEGEETEEDIQKKMQAFSRKRETLKLVFLSLCALEDEAEGIRDAMREKIELSFDEYYKEGSDFSQMSHMFMGQIIGGDSRINRALKATNQSIIAPAVIALSFSKLGQTYRYKDRKLWRVFVHIAPDAVVITNQRGEQSVVPPDSAEFFEFTWELMIVFNREVTEIVDVRINVVDVVYSDKATEAFKDKLEQMLGPLYNRDETVETYLERRRAQIEEERLKLLNEHHDGEGEEENGDGGTDEEEEQDKEEEKEDSSGSGSDSDDTEDGDSRKSRRRQNKKGSGIKGDARRKPQPINLSGASGRDYVKQMIQYVNRENARLDEDEEEWDGAGHMNSGSLTTRPPSSVPKRSLLTVPVTERRHHSSSPTDVAEKRKAVEKRSKADDEIGDDVPIVDRDGDSRKPKRSSSSSSLLSTSAPPSSGKGSPNNPRRGGTSASQRREAADDTEVGERRSEKRKSTKKKKSGSEILLSSRERNRDKTDRARKDRASTAIVITPTTSTDQSSDTVRDRKKERKQMYAALVGVDPRRDEEKRRRHGAETESMTLRRLGGGLKPDRSGSNRVPALNLAGGRSEHLSSSSSSSSSSQRYRNAGGGTYRPSASSEATSPRWGEAGERRAKDKHRTSARDHGTLRP